MKKKLLKQIIEYSYSNGELDKNKVLRVANELDRESLKQFITALKFSEKKRTVYIELAGNETEAIKKEISGFFPDKKVIFKKNPTLLLGMRITNNDDIMDYNLDHQLHDLVQFVEE